MKKIITLLLVLSLAFSLFAGGSAEKNETVKKDIITMAIPVDPDGLDPQLTASASTFQISSNIYETLITVDDKGEIIPALASSWSVS